MFFSMPKPTKSRIRESWTPDIKNLATRLNDPTQRATKRFTLGTAADIINIVTGVIFKVPRQILAQNVLGMGSQLFVQEGYDGVAKYLLIARSVAEKDPDLRPQITQSLERVMKNLPDYSHRNIDDDDDRKAMPLDFPMVAHEKKELESQVFKRTGYHYVFSIVDAFGIAYNDEENLGSARIGELYEDGTPRHLRYCAGIRLKKELYFVGTKLAMYVKPRTSSIRCLRNLLIHR